MVAFRVGEEFDHFRKEFEVKNRRWGGNIYDRTLNLIQHTYERKLNVPLINGWI